MERFGNKGMVQEIRRNGLFIFFLIIIMAVTSCRETREVEVKPMELHNAMQKLTDVIVHDIFSPPAASRVYAYPSIGMYEVLALGDPSFKSLSGQLTDFDPIPEPKGEINYGVAGLEVFLTLGKQLIFSEDRMEEFRIQWHKDLDTRGIDPEILENSISYAWEVRSHMSKWIDSDNYKQTRTFQKFTIADKEDQWRPTPPGYMEAIEPHWNKIRPFVLDSATQFVPERPTDFDISEGSPFYEEIMEVYETVNSLDDEQGEIASFWDCNPYVMNVHGHVMFATKKITPGGHWIGIVKIASIKAGDNLIEAAATYALTSLTLADAFISCWDEKYRSNLIRPETVINTYIDEEWVPYLQTPPFPEYTSGHSVISSAAGTMLTSIYGDNFAFADSSEVKYGLPVRNFNSFKDAYREAAISRLYGGIHYMPAIENGVDQGEALGSFVVNSIDIK